MRKYPQLQKQSLAGNGARIGDTTLLLSSFKDIDGNVVSTMDVFGAKAFATIEPGNGKREEEISFTGLTVNGDGTVLLTGIKSVDLVYSATDKPQEYVGLRKSHAGSSEFIISNTSGFYADFLVAGDNYDISGEYTFTEKLPQFTKDTDSDGTLDEPTLPSHLITKEFLDKELLGKVATTGDETITSGVKTFVESPIVPTPTTQQQASNKDYVDGVAIAGAPNASEAIQGLVQVATEAEISAGTDTGSTGAKLVVVPSKIPKVYWDSLKTYSLSDIVNYDGSIYSSSIALNTNNVPGVFKYVAFDYTSIIFDNEFTSISGINKFSFWSKDGFNFYYYTNSNVITRCYVSTKWDLKTVTSTTTSAVFSGLVGGCISQDGTRMYFSQYTGGSIYQYNLSTAFDVTTMSYIGSIATAYPYDNSTKWVQISDDGTQLFYLKNYSTVRRVNIITLSTPFEISSGSADTLVLNLYGHSTLSQLSMQFADNGNKFIFAGVTTWYASLSTPFDLTTVVYSDFTEIDLQSSIQMIQVSEDGYYIYLIEGNSIKTYKLGVYPWKKFITNEPELDTEISVITVGAGTVTFTPEKTGFLTGTTSGAGYISVGSQKIQPSTTESIGMLVSAGDTVTMYAISAGTAFIRYFK